MPTRRVALVIALSVGAVALRSPAHIAQEFGDEKVALRALLNQPGGTYWSVFDENGKDGFSIILAGYENLDEVRKLVYETPGVVLTADSLDHLAAAMGVPAENL